MKGHQEKNAMKLVNTECHSDKYYNKESHHLPLDTDILEEPDLPAPLAEVGKVLLVEPVGHLQPTACSHHDTVVRFTHHTGIRIL